MACDYTAWLGRIRAGQWVERRCLVADGSDYRVGPVVENSGLGEVSTLRTIDFADPLVRQACEHYLWEQYLGAALLSPPGMAPSVLPYPQEPELTPVLVVDFPAGSHEAVVECRFRFGITDDGPLCDLMTGRSLPVLPEALRSIGAAADRSVERLVAEYRRLVSGAEPYGYVPAAGVEELG